MLDTESSIYPYSQGAFAIEAKDRDKSKSKLRSNYETSLMAMNNRDSPSRRSSIIESVSTSSFDRTLRSTFRGRPFALA